LASTTALPRWKTSVLFGGDVRAQGRVLRPLLVASLCAAAYAPALDNGFVSDDYVVLEWIRQWREDPTFLLKLAPDVFRITSYLILGALKAVFGYRAEWFYGFAILLHFVNSMLLWKLAARLTGSARVGFLAASLFAVVQNPQEAIMWLAAMGDALAALCVLGALLLWLENRFVLAALVFTAGLFSKESAAVLLVLVPLTEFCVHGGVAPRRRHLYLLPPTLLFAAVFLWTCSHNYMITNGTYTFGARALAVWVVSAHRVLFPWGYVAAALLVTTRRALPVKLSVPLAWIILCLAPYVFLAQGSHVPSRHTYLASMGLAVGVALTIAELRSVRLARALVWTFVAVNVAYLWRVKDGQFEVRAAPTTRLVERLADLQPGNIRVVGFPLLPGMATTATRLVPGWEPSMVLVDTEPESCPECPELRWEPATATYLLADAKGAPSIY